MTTVFEGQTPVYTGNMSWETGEVSKDTHAKLNVDDVVLIDADHEDGVIRVQHDAGDGVNILEATDKASGALSMRIDDSGVYRGDVIGATVQGTVIKYGASQTNLEAKVISLLANDAALQNDIDAVELDIDANQDSLIEQAADIVALETVVQASTHAESDPGADTLVRRSTALGTQINNLYVIGRSTGYTPASSWPPTGLTFTQGQCTGGFDVLQDARINFQPYDSNGDAIQTKIFSFGRAVPEGAETDETADEKRDGLLFVDETTDQLATITISNQTPTLRLMGSKATVQQGGQTVPVCAVFDIRNTAGDVNFAVFDDGFVIQRGHHDVDPEALNAGHFSSIVAGDQSMYIGSSRISYDRASHTLQVHKLKQAIPVYLVAQGVVVGDLPAAVGAMSVHAWIAFARTHLSNSRLTANDVFPAANADWDAQIIDGHGNTAEATEVVYVDSSYGGGTSDGSSLAPYASLSTAMSAKLIESATLSYTFKLAPGAYTGAIAIDRTTATQSFCIEGSGQDSTFVQAGTSFAAGGSSDVLNLRDFKRIEIKNLCIRYGKYGAYLRGCDSCILDNVRFVNCGSLGTVNRHDQSGTKAQQAVFWGSTDTTDGGACRIRSVLQVQIRGCSVDYCSRGLRVQDSGSAGTASIISGNRVYRTLESGIYLAAGTYNGGSGCINFHITGNTVHEAFNNGILLIGGRANTVSGNNVSRSASSGIMQWHGLDNMICSNCIFDCNRLSYAGIGSDGDAFASLSIDGDDSIASGGTYIACVQNNSIMSCNIGRNPSAVVGLQIGLSNEWGNNYPTGTNILVKDSNCTDAATAFDNPKSVSITSTNDYQPLIDAKQTQLSVSQLAIVDKSLGTVASNSSSNLCTADQIKTFVDANAGSSGTSYIHFAHMTTSVQLADDVTAVHWGRTEAGSSSGGNGRYLLPAFASNAPATHSFYVFSHNPVGGTGEIQLNIVSGSGHVFHAMGDDEDGIEKVSSTRMDFKKSARHTYKVTYRHSNTSWYFRRLTSGITDDEIDQITTNTNHFQYFENDEAGYSNSSGQVFPLPNGKSVYYVCYGTGENFGSGTGGSNVALGVNVSLPSDPVDGCRVVLYSSMHRQSSSAVQCLSVNFPGPISGIPGTRRLVAAGTANLASKSGGTKVTSPSSNDHSKNHTYLYSETDDLWTLMVDMN